jgi:hypothetical protein
LGLVASEQIAPQCVDKEALREIFGVRWFLMVIQANVRIDRHPVHGSERILRTRPYIGIAASHAPHEREVRRRK